MLRIGEACSTGAVVKTILGQSAIAAVYTTEDGQLRWSYKENGGVLPGELTAAVSRFDGLMAEIKSIAPKKHKESCYALLGKALFTALNSAPSKASIDSFDSVASYLHRLAQQRTRTMFVIQCMIATLGYSIAILAFLHLFTVPHSLYAYCAVFGALGACISVMQRAADIDIDWTLDGQSLLVQSVVRITLGLVFGAVFVLACKGDFILGVFKDMNVAIYFLAIVAGFSERMIPELFGRLEAPGKDYPQQIAAGDV